MEETSLRIPEREVLIERRSDDLMDLLYSVMMVWILSERSFRAMALSFSETRFEEMMPPKMAMRIKRPMAMPRAMKICFKNEPLLFLFFLGPVGVEIWSK